MTVTNVSLLTAKPCSNSCASFLRLFRLPRLIPRWPQPFSSVGLQALVAPFERIPVAPLVSGPATGTRNGGVSGRLDHQLVDPIEDGARRGQLGHLVLGHRDRILLVDPRRDLHESQRVVAEVGEFQLKVIAGQADRFVLSRAGGEDAAKVGSVHVITPFRWGSADVRDWRKSAGFG